MRKWGDSTITESDMAALDFSSPPPIDSPTGVATPLSQARIDDLISKDAMGSRGKDGFYTVADVDTGRGQLQGEEDEEDDMIEQALEKSRQRKEKELAGDDGDAGTGDGATGGMSGWFTRLTGGKTLTKTDLKPVLEAMEKHLMSKNVAKGIAEKMCEGVEKALVGKKLGSFTSESLT